MEARPALARCDKNASDPLPLAFSFTTPPLGALRHKVRARDTLRDKVTCIIANVYGLS